MIFKYKQVSVIPNIQHIMCNKEVIGTGTSTKHFFGILDLNNSKYEIMVDCGGEIIVKENEKTVGGIKQKIQKLNVRKIFDRTILYYEFCMTNKVLKITPICFNKKDENFYQIEENGKTIAMIQKIDKVINYNHQYVCYSETESMLPYMAVWCLFLQSTKFYPFMISGEGNVTKNRIGSSAKYIREKYDSSFIQRIKALDDISI